MTIDRVRVGEVLALQRRGVALEPDHEYEGIGVRSFGRGIFHKEPVSGVDLGNKRVFRIEPGDLVLSNVFAWEGAIAVASAAEDGRIGSHRFMTFTPVDGRLDVSWARWWFLSEPGLALIKQASPGSAGRNRTLAVERFQALEMPLPPIEEQRRVAGRLDRVALASGELQNSRELATGLLEALPLAVCAQTERQLPMMPTRLGEVLELVRDPVAIDPTARYVSIGVRSFGRGLFHYAPREGAQLGKLRFQTVAPCLLAISNIKAWEGAIATTREEDHGTVASNRFLFFRPMAGRHAVDYFWARLLGPEGLTALGRASPGSADRNRTLSLDRFQAITLNLADLDRQAGIGREVHAARRAAYDIGSRALDSGRRMVALLTSALNEAFAGLS
ncbi:MAG: restriction endonuclease subunit S [Dermatophilaceae bacterium]